MSQIKTPSISSGLAWTGERFIPGLKGEIAFEHLHRYLFALQFCEGRRVLDIASGEGYGSFILSQAASSVVGVDISEEAVAHATATYGGDDIAFRAGDVRKIPAGDAMFDVVVSFETLEHVVEQDVFLAEIRRVLKPGGVLVISTPDTNTFEASEPNEFHVRELTPEEFRSLIGGAFEHAVYGTQKPTAGSLILPGDGQPAMIEVFGRRDGAADVVERGDALQEALYVIAVGSDAPLPPVRWGALDELAHMRNLSGRAEGAERWLGWAKELVDTNRLFVNSCVYTRGEGSGYEERTAAYRAIRLRREPKTYRISSGEIEGGVAQVRFDPCEHDGSLLLHHLKVRDPGGRVLFDWDGDSTKLSGTANVQITPGPRGTRLDCAPDPQLYIDLGDARPRRVELEFRISRSEPSEAPDDLAERVGQQIAEAVDVLGADMSEVAAEVRAAVRTNGSPERVADAVRGRLASDLEGLGHQIVEEAERTQAAFLDIQGELRDIRRAQEARDRAAAAERQTSSAAETAQLEDSLARIGDALELPDAAPADLVRRAIWLASSASRARSDAAIIRASLSWRATSIVRKFKNLVASGRFEDPIPPQAHGTPSSPPPPPMGPAHDDAVGAPLTEPRRLRPPAGSAPVAFDPRPLRGSAPARLIAFYLPQFHPIPENDAWWGAGFTEWTNVTRGTPQFAGHYQPHLPADLGFYDLRVPEVQEQQVELARTYGVSGFCFYFYWFAGRRLLEMPLHQFSHNPKIDFPFCLCWANENWSRRWDGLENDVLIAQQHSPEDDIAFISHIAQYLSRPNYIRVDGRPLLLVYRPDLLPKPKATLERWRAWCRDNGIGEIFLGYTQSFETTDPRAYGFDAAVEFPPNNSGPPVITGEVSPYDPSYSGIVYDYRAFPERSASYPEPDYPLFRSVFPSWDNEARKPGRGSVFHHATPARFREWLTNALRDTVRRFPDRDRRLVFINAWNEWAEGAHLEPDQRHGFAWLDATRAAVELVGRESSARRIAVVSHDAHPHGAQFLALNLARVLSEDLGYDVHLILLGAGRLKGDYARYATVHDLSDIDPDGSEARAAVAQLLANGVKGAICNTTVSGLFLATLKTAGVRTVSLVHELAGVIRDNGLIAHAKAIADHADAVVFPGPAVRASFEKFAQPPADKVLLRTQGLYKRNGAQTPAAIKSARERLRRHFGLEAGTTIVLGVGFGDRRKGVDLFVQAGLYCLAERPDMAFIWVGELHQDLAPAIQKQLSGSRLGPRFFLPGFQNQTDDYYAGADIYALTSREDPFPTVIMEAMDVRTPVVAFSGVGDFDALIAGGTGVCVKAFDVDAYAKALLELAADAPRRRRLGEVGKAKVDGDYAFRRYVLDMAALADPGPPRVSVVVPNYNYGRLLEARLQSIDAQTIAPYEIILLDDASTDDSLETAHALAARLKSPYTIYPNDINSGSVFRQWLKGVRLAKGDLVWIAEADDLSEPRFIEEAIKPFEDPEVVLSYVQSKQMGATGEILSEDYLDYVSDIDPLRWKRSFITNGGDEVRVGLSIKNTIPNVSAVVFRRDALLSAMEKGLDEILSYRVAGDWATYVNVLEGGGKAAFTPQSLNFHRRHATGVTMAGFNASLLSEILRMQRRVRSTHRLDPEKVARGRVYAHKLYAQFGLDAEIASIEDNPEFTVLLTD